MSSIELAPDGGRSLAPTEPSAGEWAWSEEMLARLPHTPEILPIRSRQVFTNVPWKEGLLSWTMDLLEWIDVKGETVK